MNFSFQELYDGIRSLRITATQIVEASLQRAYETESLLAWRYLNESGARSFAKELDDEAKRGIFRGPLHGLTVGFKESIAVKSLPIEMGSDFFRGSYADFDSDVAARVRAAGGIPLGMQVMHEMGLGEVIRNGHRATSRHPWNDDYVPSGSSSGSAVATSAGSCVISFGGDTGGSVRGPAASCGVVGFKPSWGVIDSRGTGALSWSMDTVGIFSRDVLGVKSSFSAVVDHVVAEKPRERAIKIAPLDLTTLKQPTSEIAILCDEFLSEISNSTNFLTKEVKKIDFSKSALAWQMRIAEMRPAFTQTHFQKPGLVTEQMQGVIDSSSIISRDDYFKSWLAGEELREAIEEVFEEVDVLMLPISPSRTLTWEQSTGSGTAGSAVLDWYSYLTPFNLTGHPAISIPWKLLDESVPVAIQLVGKIGNDFELLHIAEELEKMSPWQSRIPLNVERLIF